MNERTIRTTVETNGIGIHSGLTSSVRLSPAEPGSGIFFVTNKSRMVSTRLDNVRSFLRATCLESDGARVYTVEHLLAALSALGITNLQIDVSGEEIPILDGSSLPWVELLNAAGLIDQDIPAPELRLRKTILYRRGSAEILMRPSSQWSVSYTAVVQGRSVQHVVEDVSLFETQIAPARTYCYASDIRPLKDVGLLDGIRSKSGFIVVDRPDIGDLRDFLGLDPELFRHRGEPFDVVSFIPPRFPDEMARHKILDLIGDFSLLGARLCCRIDAVGTGHADNHAALGQLLADPEGLLWINRKAETVS